MTRYVPSYDACSSHALTRGLWMAGSVAAAGLIAQGLYPEPPFYVVALKVLNTDKPDEVQLSVDTICERCLRLVREGEGWADPNGTTVQVLLATPLPLPYIPTLIELSEAAIPPTPKENL